MRYEWRGAATDEELVQLTLSYDDRAEAGWWDRIRPCIAVERAKAAGCEWLHVDFDDPLAPFYYDACGFTPSPAGVIHLPTA
jgi:hypothetical protein